MPVLVGRSRIFVLTHDYSSTISLVDAVIWLVKRCDVSKNKAPPHQYRCLLTCISSCLCWCARPQNTYHYIVYYYCNSVLRNFIIHSLILCLPVVALKTWKYSNITADKKNTQKILHNHSLSYQVNRILKRLTIYMENIWILKTCCDRLKVLYKSLIEIIWRFVFKPCFRFQYII